MSISITPPFSFQTLDKSNFICLKFKNNSFYYGEIAYLDSQGTLYLDNPNETSNFQEESVIQKDPKAKPQEKEKEAPPQIIVRKVRHGYGVQIYETSDEEKCKKYEGQWEKDKRHGYGSCFYANGSIYNGFFKNDQREGLGKMEWVEGWEYEGHWKDGRLFGKGNFKTLEDLNLSGIFKNNNFAYSDAIFFSPFLDEKGRESLIKIRQEKNVSYNKSKIQKQFQFERVRDLGTCRSLIEKSYGNERIPLIMTSTSFNLDKKDILSRFFEIIKKSYVEFNLREAYQMKTSNKLKEYMQATKEKLARALTNDEFLLINIDDYDENQDSSFDPDLREFYDSNSFPSHIWNPKLMARTEIYEKVLKDTKYQNQRPKPNSSFKLIFWSKFKIDQALDDKKIVEVFERRFSRTINLLVIDLLFIVDP